MFKDEMKVQAGYWIPCDIAIPPKNGIYTITYIYTKGDEPKVTRANFERDKNLWIIAAYKVVAWCGLPEPFKGVE